MAASNDPILGLYYGWSLGESPWNTGMDSNIKMLGAIIQMNVLSATTTAQPASPTAGDLYILPASSTGTDWATNDGKIALYVESAWQFYIPNDGWKARSADTGQVWEYQTTWKLPGSIYSQYANDTAAASGGVPVNGLYINSSSGALTVRLV